MLAVETHIAPPLLLDTPPEILEEMIAYLEERAEESERERLRQELQARVH